MPNYKHSKIYILRSKDKKDPKIYIGSTTRALEQRLAEHKYSHGKDWRPRHESSQLKKPLVIHKVESFPTSSKEALQKRENEVIKYYNKKPKTKVVNKRRK